MKNVMLTIIVSSLTIFSGNTIANTKIDKRTGLEWLLPQSTDYLETWQDALDYCNSRGWRVPNVIEYLSIIDFDKENSEHAVREGFYLPDDADHFDLYLYATSTNNYVMNFLSGEVVIPIIPLLGVRCVRGG